MSSLNLVSDNGPESYNYEFRTLRLHNKTYTIEHLNKMTHEEITQVESELLDAIWTIKAQLTEAQGRYYETGKGADPKWFKRAKGAQVIFERWRQKIQNIRKSKRDLSRYFIDVAKRLLDSETFDYIVIEAKEQRRTKEG